MATNTEIIKKAQEAIIDAHSNVMLNYVPGETKNKINAIHAELCQLTWYSAFTKDNIVRVTDKVFSDRQVLDFTMNLTMQFNIRFAELNNEYLELIKIVSSSICQIPGDEETLIPKPVRTRLPTEDEIESFLISDKWLLTIILLVMFVPFRLERLS